MKNRKPNLKQIDRLLERGATLAEAAEKLGMTRNSLISLRKKLGGQRLRKSRKDFSEDQRHFAEIGNKITLAKATQIKFLLSRRNRSQSLIAKIFKVSPSLITLIKQGKLWRRA